MSAGPKNTGTWVVNTTIILIFCSLMKESSPVNWRQTIAKKPKEDFGKFKEALEETGHSFLVEELLEGSGILVFLVYQLLIV